MNVDNLKRILRSLEKRGVMTTPENAFICEPFMRQTRNNDFALNLDWASVTIKTLVENLSKEVGWPKINMGDGCSAASAEEVMMAVQPILDITTKELIAMITLAQELIVPLEDEKSKK